MDVCISEKVKTPWVLLKGVESWFFFMSKF